jgi:hypothetical protein
MTKLLAIALLLVGCTEDVDPAWQLDHDRIIAVRSTPSRIASGEVAELDALLGRFEQPPIEVDPLTAEVVSPASLAGTLMKVGTKWTVTAPSSVQLDAVRTELGLAAGDPVPVRIRVRFAELDKSGLKIVWLGEHADNPVINPILVDGVDVTTAPSVSVSAINDVPLSVDFDETYVVNWLSSCGTLHDFDLANAYLTVEPEDDTSGTLGVVVRDTLGGVAWHTLPITAE